MSQPPFGPPPGDTGRGEPSPAPPPIPQAPPGQAVGGSPQWQQPPGGHPSQQDTPGPTRWQQLPPEQLTRLHQPGVVPLRPLTLGDMFGGSLQTMRRNPEATIGMGLVVLSVVLVPSLLLTLLATRSVSSVDQLGAELILLLVGGLLSSLASIALTGMIVHVVGEAVLGDRASLASTWAAVRGRLLALVGTVLLLGVLFTAALVALVAAAVGLVVGLGESGLAVLLVVLLSVAFVVGLVWAGCRLSLAPAPVVLERVGPWRGIARAWALTKGAQAWRVVGITVLAGIVTGILAAIVQLPVVAVVSALVGPEVVTSPLSPVTVLTDHALQLVVGALTIPFTAGVTALLYLDQRIRREGLDVSLVAAAQERAATRSR
ncbi:hypothetical protein AVL62_06405 [Serinicoccus chungangensis]|uniref:Glycerophosphoryl diester phosphodiesterase membrane domain-containing protein n=1 Tax=Serinicoccus chungangensis TaxID=767452 RepID=A0A0W8IHH8_9MICO|nr:hypothetical protein [Serinicoccus chungangensis]KUG59307.1 hypothetical protein AVL62_06405 [Serinicoccus chungangensis]